MNLSPAAEALLRELLGHGIPVELTLLNNGIAYKVGGFYKSGSVTLEAGSGLPSDPLFRAHARYGGADEIRTLLDLALLNYDWLTRQAFPKPDSKWAPLLEAQGLIGSPDGDPMRASTTSSHRLAGRSGGPRPRPKQIQSLCESRLG